MGRECVDEGSAWITDPAVPGRVWIGNVGGIQWWDFMDCYFPCLKSLVWELAGLSALVWSEEDESKDLRDSQGMMPGTGSCGSLGWGWEAVLGL